MSADFLARGYSMFVTYLAEPAARSLMIGCVAAAALAAFRVKRVGTRLLVWTAVLCAGLAMPFLGALLPRMSVKIPAIPLVTNLQAKMNRSLTSESQASILAPVLRELPVASVSNPALASQNNSTASGRRATHREVVHFAALAPGAASPLSSTNDSGTPSLSSAPISRNASRGTTIPWVALLLTIYLAAVVILFARLFVGMCFSRRLERAAENIDAGDDHGREALRLLRFRSCIADLSQAPRLKESALLAVPATLGIHRSAILLPANWRSWSEEQLDAVLAHEISHVARRDGLTQFLSLVHRAIFWFNPLSWWLDRELIDLAEQASDEAALAGGADRARYAETLLAFLGQLAASRRRVWWQGVAMAKQERKAGSAERRVSRILAWKGGVSMKNSFAFAIISIAAPLIFLAASVHPFIAHAQDVPKPPAKPVSVIVSSAPVAPALPGAPKGGIIAPAMPSPPKDGMNRPPFAPPAAPVQLSVSAPPPKSASDSALQGLEAQMAEAQKALQDARVRFGPASKELRDARQQMASAHQALMEARRLTKEQHDAAQIQEVSAAIAEMKHDLQEAEAAQQSLIASGISPMKDAETELRRAQQLYDNADRQFISDSANVHISQQTLLVARKAMAAGQAQLAMAQAALAQQDQSTTMTTSVTVNGSSYTMGGGGRYVIIGGKGENVEMSGDDEDLRHAKELRAKLGKDLIWFERDEKSYVITDPDFIARAKALFAPEDALAKQQDELGRQQDALGAQQDALGEKQDSVKVKVPDISPDLQRIKGELDALRNQGGATQEELGRMQAELGRLQGQVGRFQSNAGVSVSQIARQQGELGRQMGELGRRQGELGREQGQLARRASQQLRQMLEDSIAKGIAKPE